MVARLSRRRCTVVATGTAGGHTGMIKHGSGKCIGIVAIIADVTAGNMVGRFSSTRETLEKLLVL